MADNIGGRQISGVGGHEDFVAAAETPSRRALADLCQVDRHGERPTVSRITGLLPEGSVVSTPRHHTGVVVTEYGVAELTGLTVRERAHALADIAHPDFRSSLQEVADSLGHR